MNWAFDSWSEFFAMGKHGFYVWSSYGVFFGLLILLVLVSYGQFKSWQKTELKRLQRLKLQKEHEQSVKKQQ